MDEKESKKVISEHMSKLGKKGGDAVKAKYGSAYYAKLSKKRKGMTWTWSKNKKK